MKKILIIQTAFIGDVILATSLIQEVKREFPDSKIDFLLRKGNESIIETLESINKVLIWDKKSNKLKSLFKLIWEVRKTQYDTVINIQRFFNSGLICALSGAPIKIGFDKNPLSFLFKHKIKHLIPHEDAQFEYLHEVQRNQLLLGPISENFQLKAKSDLKLFMQFDEHDKKIIDDLKLSTSYIVLAPTSVWFTKQYSIEQWIEFIAQIPQTYEVLIIGAPTDSAQADILLNKHPNARNLCGKLSLRQSALLMKDATRVFVNDSAPLHLASAVNAKVTAIFCSTIPAFGYTPISDDSIVLETPMKLNCRPCGLHGKKSCPEGHFKCSKLIDSKSLLQTIDLSKS